MTRLGCSTRAESDAEATKSPGRKEPGSCEEELPPDGRSDVARGVAKDGVRCLPYDLS